jgi:hypothetical protein
LRNIISAEARKVLEENDRSYGDRRYFVAASTYPLQYYWDSCAQAIVMSLFDGERAQEEVGTLLSTQFGDGCMPYLTSWGRTPFPWNLFLGAANWIGEDGRANMTTQPMLSAFATWEIYKRTGDRDFLEKVIPELAREADYVGVQRDLLDDGLTVIVNSMEAGTNESPVYDEIMGLPRPRGLGPLVHLAWYVKVSRRMARYKHLGYDLERIAIEGDFLVEDMISNSLFCRSLRAMGDILDEVGEDRAAGEYRKQAKKLADRMEKMCWDETDAFFYTRYGGRGGRRFSRVKTIAGMLPLFTGMISRDRAEALVDRHLTNTGEFWTPWPASFVSIDEPAYRRKYIPWPLPSLWRAGTWICMNWMLQMGLLEYGFEEQAERLASTSALLVVRGGFREFYSSFSGRPFGAKSCGMATVVADMLQRQGDLKASA